jgi:4-hydroxymandelate oxidase
MAGPAFIAPPSHAYIAGGCGPELTLAANRQPPSSIGDPGRVCCATCPAGIPASNCSGARLQHPVLLAPVAYQTWSIRSAKSKRRAVRPPPTVAWWSAPWPAGRWKRWPRRPATSAGSSSISSRAAPIPPTCSTRRKRRLQGHDGDAGYGDQDPQPARPAAGFAMPPVVAASLRTYPVPPQKCSSAGKPGLPGHDGVKRRPGTISPGCSAQTRLPVIVKGVLHPAMRSGFKAMGVAGQVVSNHGGRALDGAPASLRVLAGVSAPPSGRLPAAARQRHPFRQRHFQGPGARRRRGHGRPPAGLCAGRRRRARRRPHAETAARRTGGLHGPGRLRDAGRHRPGHDLSENRGKQHVDSD